MKAYTDLEQSRKLAEILPLESADMCFNISQRSNMPPLMTPYSKFKEFFDMDKTPDFLIPCWSLSALLGLMPTDDKKDEYYVTTESHSDYYIVSYKNCWDGCIHSEDSEESLLDAAFEMIVWLKENGKL